jgi:hypothetical protein
MALLSKNTFRMAGPFRLNENIRHLLLFFKKNVVRIGTFWAKIFHFKGLAPDVFGNDGGRGP